MEGSSLVEREWKGVAWGNFQTNLEFLQKAGILTRTASVLEIGCGKGMLLNTIRELVHSATGIDTDPEAIALCRASFPTINAQVASGDEIPFLPESFDIVLSFDVFEHIRDSDLHLREVRRVLKPDGHYLLQTPNKWTNIPFELIRHWRKFGMGPIAGYREMSKEHCSLHNYWELRRRFVRNGFTMSYVCVPVVNDYFKSKMQTYFGFAAKPLLALLNPDRFPQPLRTNFYVKAERATAGGQ
jgi:SAM-dependent methyltransferase